MSDQLAGMFDEDEVDDVDQVEPIFEDHTHDAEPQNLYDSVDAFVAGFLVQVYARKVDALKTGFRWCPKWWEHAEAVSRLEALWKAFEILRLDPGTGAAVWWRDYCDPTMSALCDSDGAFRQCSPTEHQVQPDLPIEAPPGWFSSARDTDPA